MANNGGRQAGGGGNGQMNEHVEFTVKAEEDLYLSGSENTIRRVIAETNYSCLMLKTQRFSSLFRHYAKYHGLRKDDLEYYFVNPLDNEDTPESVQLQRGDTIMVRKRRKPEPPEAAADDEEFFKDMRELLDDEEHMDCVFLVFPDGYDNNTTSTTTGSSLVAASVPLKQSSAAKCTVKQETNDDDTHMDTTTNTIDSEDNRTTDTATATTAASTTAKSAATATTTAAATSSAIDFGNKIPIKAHKCILTARAEYFKALFRKNNNQIAFRESEECIIRVEPDFGPIHIRCLLEFVYTNRIQQIKDLSTDDLLSLLHLSDRWLLRDLKRLVEHELIRNHMSITTVARMYGATEDFKAQRLSRACIDFIMENLRQLAGNAAFEEEMKNYPHLCIPVLKAAVDLIPEGPVHKKQRTDHHGGSSSNNNNNNNSSSNNNNASSSGHGNDRADRGDRSSGADRSGGSNNNNNNDRNNNNNASSPDRAAAADGGAAAGGGAVEGRASRAEAAAARAEGNAGNNNNNNNNNNNSSGSSPVPDSDP